MQVAHTLAVAEEAMEFEHRDLHWGNVLVKEVKGPTVCEYKLDGDVFKVLKVTGHHYYPWTASVTSGQIIIAKIKNICHLGGV